MRVDPLDHSFTVLDRWLLSVLKEHGAMTADAFAEEPDARAAGSKRDTAVLDPRQVAGWLDSARRRGLLEHYALDLPGGGRPRGLSELGRARLAEATASTHFVPDSVGKVVLPLLENAAKAFLGLVSIYLAARAAEITHHGVSGSFAQIAIAVLLGCGLLAYLVIRSPGHATAAIAEWRAAKRHQPPVRPGVETRTPDPETWARYTSEVAALRERLRSVPIDDRALWAHVTRDTAGAFAAWSQRVEVTPGPLADTARVVARCAQLPAHQARPRPAGLPSARGAALVLAAVAQPANKTLAHTVLLRQLANTVKALHDARRAAGDARAADAIRAVVTERLEAVHAALPAEPKAPRVVVEDVEAAEAVRVASQGQLPARVPGPPAPGKLDAARPSPERRPAVRRPEKTEIER